MKVWIADIITAISRFNDAGKNLYGELVPIKGHSPLMIELRTGEPPDTSGRFPEYPRLETPFFTADRNAEDQSEIERCYVDTDRAYLYPMTKAYVSRGWHRVYKFNTATGEVEDVRLLVWPRQDPHTREEQRMNGLKQKKSLGQYQKMDLPLHQKMNLRAE